MSAMPVPMVKLVLIRQAPLFKPVLGWVELLGVCAG